MQTINEDIKNGQFHSSYLIYGEEIYLVQQYKKKLANAVVDVEDHMNRSIYMGKDVDVPAIIDASETMPFFSERRLILIEDSGLFKGSAEELASYLAEVPESTVFIFVESEVDKRGKLYKAINKNGHVAEFKRQTQDTLMRWILGRVKKENKSMTRQTLELFLSKTGDDMSNIENELEKLFSYTLNKNEILEKDVEEVCTSLITNHIFDMVDAISGKNQKKALALYNDLVTLREPPARILYLIARQFNILLQVRELRLKGNDSQTIAKKVGIPEFAVKKNGKQAASFSVEQLQNAVTSCVEAEEDFKTGRLDERLSVEMLIIKLLR